MTDATIDPNLSVLRSGVREGCIIEWETVLDRRDMKNNARFAFHHARKKRTVQANGCQEIQAKGCLPVTIREYLESSVRGIRPASTVDQNVESIPFLLNPIDYSLRASGGADIRLDKDSRAVILRQRGACGCRNQRTA